MGKNWIFDIPAEIRTLVYRHLFSDHTVRMHWSTCACDSDCPFHTPPNEHRASAFSISAFRHEVFGPDLQAPRCVRAPACIHTSLFLTCKTVLDEARPVFYRLSTFQTHPACIANLPRLLENFTSDDAAWRIGYLRDLRPHEIDTELTKTLLSQYRGHITHLAISFAHFVRGRIELDEETGDGFVGNMATRTKLTVTNGYHVDIQDDELETVEKIKRLFHFAYSQEDYAMMSFEYRGPVYGGRTKNISAG